MIHRMKARLPDDIIEKIIDMIPKDRDMKSPISDLLNDQKGNGSSGE